MTDILTSDMVKHPEMCRMVLAVYDGRLDVVIYSTVEDNSLIYRSIPLDPEAASPLRALEDALYANPLLVQDNFGRVTVLIDTNLVTAVPNDAPEDEAQTFFSELYPDMELELIETAVRGGAKLCLGVDTKLLAFIRRTFPSAAVMHRIAPLCNYFGIRGRLGSADRIHIHLHDKRVDIIAYSGDNMLIANSFDSTEPTDDLYYILAVAKELGFENETDRMILSGDAARRDKILPLLRRYISHAMPAIFPTALFRLGKDAMSVPLEMLTLQLCE